MEQLAYDDLRRFEVFGAAATKDEDKAYILAFFFSSFGPFKIYKKEPDVHMRITFFKTHWCPAPTDNVSFHCNFWRCWQ